MKQDIANLYGIFKYIDKVSKRMGAHIQRDLRDSEEARKRKEKAAAEAARRQGERGGDKDSSSSFSSSSGSASARDDLGVFADASLHWEDYEGMTDIERAALLEKAIGVLTHDQLPVTGKDKYKKGAKGKQNSHHHHHRRHHHHGGGSSSSSSSSSDSDVFSR